MAASVARCVLLAGLLVSATSCSLPGPAIGPVAPRTALTERAWTDERGAQVRLATWRGRPLVVTMIYRTCQFRCPMTLAKLRRVATAFREAGEPVEVVLVTLDPRNDTPARLADFKQAERLGDAWHLLNGDDESTRALARFLRVHASNDDNHIDHDVKIAVFDGAGRFTTAFEGWDFAAEDVIAATKR